MKWRVISPPRVLRRIANIGDETVKRAMLTTVASLTVNPTDPAMALPITSAPGAWRIRIGNWRLLYVLFPNENPPEVVLGDAVQRSGNTYTKARLRRLMDQARLRRNP